jgi:hypothetical protein
MSSAGRSPMRSHSTAWPAWLAAALLIAAAAPRAACAAPVEAPPAFDICAGFYRPGWTPLDASVAVAEPPLPKPAKGIPFRDPVHGTCLMRVSEHDKEPPQGFARSDYSRRQAFNADDTRFVLVAMDGSWHLYDANTLAHLEALKPLSGAAEPQWHPTDPDLLYFVPRDGVGMKLMERNVRTGAVNTIGDFAERLKARWPDAQTAWTHSEGSPSADGRYWCFMVDSSKWEGLGLFTWDRDTDRIIGMHDLHGERPDHVSMSPSGDFCVAASDASGTVAFSRDLAQRRLIRPRGEHSDIARASNGNDVYVSVDYDASGGPVFMVDLRTGVRTELFSTYVDGTATALHFSGKAYGRPGWVVVSTYAEYAKRGPLSPKWLHRRVFAVSLQAKPRIVPLAHTRVRYAKYWTEPQATANRNLTRILFNSNWGIDSPTDVDTYMITVPAAVFAGPR